MKILSWVAAAVVAGGAIAATSADAHAQTGAPQNANTVYQLIQSRRGMWLMRSQPTDMSGTGSGQLLVFMDGAQLDGLDDLKQLPLAGVRTVEFLSPAETEHKLGKYTVIGAIRVLTRDETPADSANSSHH
jgi:hypothetical protein